MEQKLNTFKTRSKVREPLTCGFLREKIRFPFGNERNCQRSQKDNPIPLTKILLVIR